jgi:amino acid adenylation domain-containing protein/non-ribosomal peptide synthase protein (TIGR01720 family)
MNNLVVNGFRLSPQQGRLWMLQQGALDYRAQCALLLEGPLDRQALRRALRQIVDRHEILRTRFHRETGMKAPVQVIEPEGRISWRVESLNALEAGELDRRIAKLWEEERVQNRDERDGREGSEAWLGMMLALVELNSTQHLLSIAMPALCADAWTIQRFIKELQSYYGGPLGLEELSDEPLQYVDFVEWQYESLEESSPEGAAFWDEQGLAEIAPVSLAVETSSPPASNFNPACYVVPLADELKRKLERYVEEQGAEVEEIMQAAWLILLRRLSGASELLTGLVSDGRPLQPLREAFGLFARTLPFRFQISEADSFASVRRNLAAARGRALKWQSCCQLERLLAESGSSDPAYLPVSFEHERRISRGELGGGVRWRLEKQFVCNDRFHLKLNSVVYEAGVGMEAEFHYDPGRIARGWVECVAEQFEQLLRGAMEEPESPIGSLSLSTAREREMLVVGVNEAASGEEERRLAHEWFERQADENPERVAVVDEQGRVSYRRLEEDANRVAKLLREQGVSAESRVALVMKRDARLVACLLGVMKAGGAYAPLDGGQPRRRLEMMLEETGPEVILTERESWERAGIEGVESKWKVVKVDEEWEEIGSRGAEREKGEVEGMNAVYVIMTSGSTGRPKAVVVEHRQLSNYVGGVVERCGLRGGMRYGWVSTVAADLGNTALYGALATGGELHVIGEELWRDAEGMGRYFEREEIDCVKIVPSHLRALQEEGKEGRALPRERLIVGGESASMEWVRSWQEESRGCEVHNHYGPTETTVGALTRWMRRGEEELERAPLGSPLRNVEVYVMDEEMEVVSRGERGEIYIGGKGVTRGYLGRGGETAEKYAPHPYGRGEGERLYRTGDIGRYVLNGEVEFLGRVDHQVKIRGFRIELGEIEAALREHVAVRESLVMAREDKAGRQRLAAYVVPEKGAKVAAAELQEFVRERLPEQMQPAAVAILGAWPLTSNGKIDRRALPSLEEILPHAEKVFVAPRNEKERLLAGVWERVLGLERVGVHDNFFDLGGDSIMSIQIIARSDQAGLKLEPKQIFRFQTIAELAAVAVFSQPVQAEQGTVTGRLPLTPIQRWFFEQRPVAAHHWNQSVMLEVDPTLGPDLLERAWLSLLAHHDALRLRFDRQDGGWAQMIAGGAPAPLMTRLDISATPEELRREAIEAAAFEAQASLNLEQGRLLHSVFFNLGPPQPARLLIVIHHLAIDGVSWRILLEDLQGACQRLSRGEAVNLPPKTTSFKEWAGRLSAFAAAGNLNDELPFWLAESRKRVVPLPRDFQGGHPTESSMRTIPVALDEEETRALLQEVPQAYHTQINDVLLTALAQTFAGWTGDRALLVELEGHGRESIIADVDVSRTVGWFTTHFPVLLDVAASASPGDALRSVKEQLRAVPRRGIGYGLLRYLSEDPATVQALSVMPQAEINFNYLGQFDRSFPPDSYFRPAPESGGPERGADEKRQCLLYVNGRVIAGRLRFDWAYSERAHRPETIGGLAENYMRALRSLIEHCTSGAAGGYTPSDFPEADVSQSELDNLLAAISQSGGGQSR